MEPSLLKSLLSMVGGGLFGYLYYKFIGCRSGACPLTSNPVISTVYGIMVGFFMSRG